MSTDKKQAYLTLTYGIADFCGVEDQETKIHATREDAHEHVQAILDEFRSDDPQSGWHLDIEEDGDVSWFQLRVRGQDGAAFGITVRPITLP